MNDPERQLLANIERDEQWLARFPTVLPDQPTLERVKFRVRLASRQMESDAMVGPMTTALEKAKTAVHRELSLAIVRRRRVIRMFSGILAAAAVIAFAFLGFQRGAEPETPADARLNAFVESLSRSLDDVELALLEVDSDLAGLEIDAYGSAGLQWDDALLDPLSEELDKLEFLILSTEEL